MPVHHTQSQVYQIKRNEVRVLGCMSSIDDADGGIMMMLEYVFNKYNLCILLASLQMKCRFLFSYNLITETLSCRTDRPPKKELFQ